MQTKNKIKLYISKIGGAYVGVKCRFAGGDNRACTVLRSAGKF